VTRRTSQTYDRIYRTVKRIPKGRVATYGQVAVLAAASGPRQVGYALNALEANSGVPWHRVINAQGRVSPRAQPGWEQVQRGMLEAEGLRFDEHGRIPLARYQWKPRDALSRFTARKPCR